MYGSLTINLADSPNAVLLPTSALVIDGSKPSVLVADSGQARRREIELGYNDGKRVHVTGGLKGDEQVITDGKNSLREGQPVRIVK
jgi:membrane fusion protein (multidrug efflux system)